MKQPEITDVPPLQQEIERILDSLLIGEVEPEDDESLLLAKYQDQKKNGTLILHEIENISGIRHYLPR